MGLALAPAASGAAGESDVGIEVERTTPPAVVEERAPEARPEDPTGFTTVIELDSFDGENRRAEDLIEMVPGVHVRRFGGPGEAAEISIRGSTGSQVVVLLDGVRLNSAQSGTVDLSTIPAGLIERIEVTRGGGSVQTGSDAIGGVVHIITRRASAKRVTRLSGAVGSWETYKGSLSQTGRVGSLEMLLGYDFFKTSGDWKFEPVQGVNPGDSREVERINNRSEQHAGLLKIGRDLGERARLELSDSFFHASEGRPGLDRAAGGALRGQRARAHLRRTRNAAQVHLKGVEATSFDVDWDLRVFHRFDRSRFRDPDLTPPGDSDDVSNTLGGRFGLEHDWVREAVTQRLSLGSELRFDDYDPRGARDHDRRVIGVFGQDELRLLEGRLKIVPALRFDDTEGFDGEWIPRVGIFVQPFTWLRLKGNAERSYRVPNFDELFLDEGTLRGNPGLRPEDARNYDLGFELSRSSGGPFSGLALELVGFWNDIDNTIVFQQISTNVIQATNISDARSRGLELSGRASLGCLQVSGSYTYLDTENRRGDPLPGRPEHEADLRAVLVSPGGAFKLAGTLLYTDDIPLNESGRLFLSGRTTYDASLRVALHALSPWPARLGLGQLAFSVAWTNLTDRAVRDALGFPRPGRILTFLLEARR